jgi:hypothetical protein
MQLLDNNIIVQLDVRLLQSSSEVIAKKSELMYHDERVYIAGSEGWRL